MTERLLSGVPIWHWVMPVISLVMTAEYARIFFLTDAPGHRAIPLLIWLVLLTASAARIFVRVRNSVGHNG